MKINTASCSGYDTDSEDYIYSFCVPHALSCTFCVQSCELAFACDKTKIPSLDNSLNKKRYELIWVDRDQIITIAKNVYFLEFFNIRIIKSRTNI